MRLGKDGSDVAVIDVLPGDPRIRRGGKGGESKQTQASLNRMREERREYNDVVGRTLAQYALLKRPPGRLPMGKRAQLQEMLLAAMGNKTAEEVRQSYRARFNETVVSLVKQMRAAVPTLVVQFGEAQEEQVASLFRRRDLLRARQCLAMATRQQSDAEACVALENSVLDDERRFIHNLLFGSLSPAVSYDDVLAVQRESLRDARVELTVDDVLERAFRQTVRCCERYAEQGSFSLGQPFGDETPEQEQSLWQTMQDLFRSFTETPEESETAFSMQHATNMANVAMAFADAGQQQRVEAGQLTEEQRQESASYWLQTWRQLADVLRPVTTATSKTGRSLAKRLKAAVQEKVRQVLDKLNWRTLGRVFSVLALLSFLLMVYGVYTYNFSALSALDKADTNYARVVESATVAREKVGDIAQHVAAEKVHLAEALGALGRGKGKEFLQIDPLRDDLDSPQNRIVIGHSLSEYVAAMKSEIARLRAIGKTEDNDYYLARERALPIIPVIERFQAAVRGGNYADQRVEFEKIHSFIQSNVNVNNKAGISYSVSDLEEMLLQKQKLMATLGVTTDEISAVLGQQQDALDDLGANLLEAREKVRKTSIGAPFLMTMLQGAGLGSYLDPTQVHPLAQVMGDHFCYQVADAKVASSLQFLGQIEFQMHQLLQASGVFASEQGWYEYIQRIVAALFTWDFANVLYHALCAVPILVNLATPYVKAGAALYKAFSETMLGDWLHSLSPFNSQQYDDELKALIDAMMGDDPQSTVDERVQRAYKMYQDGELGDWKSPLQAAVKYGRLVELLYDKKKVYAGSAQVQAVLAAGSNWYDMGLEPARYLSQIAGVRHIWAQYGQFFYQLYWITTTLYGILSGWQLGLVLSALTLTAVVYEKLSGRIKAETWTSLVGEIMLAPLSALMRVTWNNTFTVMNIVWAIYAALHFANPALKPLLQQTAEQQQEEALRQGFSRPVSHLYERKKATEELQSEMARAAQATADANAAMADQGIRVEQVDTGILSLLNDFVVATDESPQLNIMLERAKMLNESAK